MTESIHARKPVERASAYLGALRRILNDRGRLAALRRGLIDNPRMQVDAWPVVASLGGDISQPIFLAIASLYAKHPMESRARTFGETCRAVALNDSSDRNLPESYERRFRRLLACGDTDDVIGQLRSWVALAASKKIGINYEGVFADLWIWQWYSDDIRVRWAKSFWPAAAGNPQDPRTDSDAIS